ncbi:DUF2846 domain-containing protein [Microbulbifer sp. ANSA005]|uniref:DUF2846 domain-containing protein n=1 Tax=Microbulbifer sp. ANSA005 TaxID=3243362 RepID=UPI0040437946
MRSFIVAFFVILLSGCTATGPVFEKVAEPNGSKAIAYFFRQAAFYGSGTCPDLVINDKEVGCLKNGGFFEVELDPGEHTVLFDKGTWEPNKALRAKITVQAGEVYFFEYGQAMTGIFATPILVSVSGREDFHQKTKEYSVPILLGLKKS